MKKPLGLVNLDLTWRWSSPTSNSQGEKISWSLDHVHDDVVLLDQKLWFVTDLSLGYVDVAFLFFPLVIQS